MGARIGPWIAAALPLAACSGAPPLRMLSRADATAPAIRVSADGRTASTSLTVLTYISKD
ncbi:MAG: hypothetical protein ACREB5_01065 [Sphingomonadaceae bacterium]